MIAFEQLVNNESIADNTRWAAAMLLFYGETLPKDFSVGFTELLNFYRCGADKAAIDEENRQLSGGTSKEPKYDFVQDDQYIYSAFLDQYGIDLNKVEYLHWWEFRALFVGLKQDCEISRIMGYRAMKIPSKGIGKEEKAFYKRMKALFRIRKPGVARKISLEERNQRMKAHVKRCAEEVRKAREQREGK